MNLRYWICDEGFFYYECVSSVPKNFFQYHFASSLCLLVMCVTVTHLDIIRISEHEGQVGNGNLDLLNFPKVNVFKWIRISRKGWQGEKYLSWERH